MQAGFINLALHQNDLAAFQHSQGSLDLALTQAGSLIEDPASLGGDAMSNLGEGDAVAILAKAEGSAANVEKHFQFSAGKMGHEGVKDFVGDLGGVGELEAWEGGLIICDHKKPPAATQARNLTLALEAATLFLSGKWRLAASRCLTKLENSLVVFSFVP
jgi:hypothetical protein